MWPGRDWDEKDERASWISSNEKDPLIQLQWLEASRPWNPVRYFSMSAAVMSARVIG